MVFEKFRAIMGLGIENRVLRIFVPLRIRNQKLAFGKFRVPPAFSFVKILCSPEIYPPGY